MNKISFKRNFRTYYFFHYAIVLLVIVITPFGTIAQQNSKTNQAYVPGEIIVKFKPTPEILKTLQPLAEKPRNPQKRTNLIKSEKTALLRIAGMSELLKQFGSFETETIVPIPRFIRSPTGQRLNAENIKFGRVVYLS